MISIKIPDELENKLKTEAIDREMSISALIRWIIKDYFKNKENGLRDIKH